MSKPAIIYHPTDEQSPKFINNELAALHRAAQGVRTKIRSATLANSGIYIGQDSDAGGGSVAGVNGVVKLPPELLLKMREVLAIGVAKSIIANSLAELQSVEVQPDVKLLT